MTVYSVRFLSLMPPGDDLARSYADVNLESVRSFFAKLIHGVMNFQGRADCAKRIVVVRHRRTKQGHDGVADVLVHRAAEIVDYFVYRVKETLHQRMSFFRVELLGQAREAGNIGEQDRDLAALLQALCRRGAARDVLSCPARRIG